jgi:U3 small nucleolar RNA-associated protein 24
MSCLLASVKIVITDCVMAGMHTQPTSNLLIADRLAELEKLGARYRLALRVARDPRWERLRCDHKG